jgi:tetratricopeptide (TPR) repeat protein
MSKWRDLMAQAEAAKAAMLRNRSVGEREFGSLLAKYPRDGMVFFKRGEAFEALGEMKLAETDYRKAEELFPKAEWKTRARQGGARVSALSDPNQPTRPGMERPTSTWRDLMAKAEAAKRAMLRNRLVGEREFDILLAAHPMDGMAYFKRGEARESLGEVKLAEADYRKAEELFPRAIWKRRAWRAAARVNTKASPNPQAESSSTGSPNFEELGKLLEYCDERCRETVRACAGQGRPLPEVGFELQDEQGRVCAEAELAWPSKKFAMLLPDQDQPKAIFVAQGWRVFSTDDEQQKLLDALKE